MPNDSLVRYHFTDDHGHPLENCVEYRELLAENERLREDVARLDKEADWLIEYICNKCSTRCPMPEGYRCKHKFKNVCYLNPSETETRGRCWRWAARKAVEEEERHG